MELLSSKLNIIDQIKIQQQRAKKEMTIRIVTTLIIGIISSIFIIVFSLDLHLTDIFHRVEIQQISHLINKIATIEIFSLTISIYTILIIILLHSIFSIRQLNKITSLFRQTKFTTTTP
ncbi:MAG: hypothetical protein IJN66_03000 [Muribaculaceae bacterium]|nr:hypothetical protein [Muribaculaceae bacterium]